MFDFSKTQAIISDFDNTITPTSEIHPDVVDAVKRIQKRDIIFTIATGRHGHGVMEMVFKKLELDHPYIVCGGAEILDPRSGTYHWKSQINITTSIKILDLLIAKQVMFTAESEQKIYGHLYPFSSDYGDGMTKVDLEEIKSLSISKIVPRPDLDVMEDLYETLLENFKDIHLTRARASGDYGVIDITNAGASKHLAVLEFCKLYNLDPHHIIGIGDSYNDYPLLTACGYKVATEDAPQELKEIADEIIPIAKECGILEILKKC